MTTIILYLLLQFGGIQSNSKEASTLVPQQQCDDVDGSWDEND